MAFRSALHKKPSSGLDESRVSNLVEALAVSVVKTTPAKAGDTVPEGETLTYFHSSVVPQSTVRSLVRALVKSRIAFDWTTVAVAVALVQRYRRLHGDSSVTPHMLHRMLIGALLIAAKAHQDVVPTNALVAQTVNILPTELSRIETALLHALRWRVNISLDTIDQDEAELLLLPTPVASDDEEGPSPSAIASGHPSPSSVRAGLDAPWMLPVA